MSNTQQATEFQERLSAIVGGLAPVADHLSGAIEEFVRAYAYQILSEEPLDRQATTAVAEISGLGRMLRESVGRLTDLLKDSAE